MDVSFYGEEREFSIFLKGNIEHPESHSEIL
jgi:hypothetical protein